MEEIKNYFTKNRLIAWLTILVIISNLFLPYSVLAAEVENEPNAQSDETGLQPGEAYFVLKLNEVQDPSTNWDDWTIGTKPYYFEYDKEMTGFDNPEDSTTHAIAVDLLVKGSSTANQAALNLKFDGSKITPSYEESSGRGSSKKYWMEPATTIEDFADIKWSSDKKGYDQTNSIIRVDGGSAAGTYMPDGYMCARFIFKLNDGVSLSDITKDTFSLVNASGAKDGLQIWWYDNDNHQQCSIGTNYLKFEGFAGESKNIAEIVIDQGLVKDKYYKGEDIDFTGVNITVKYDDGSEEVITDIEKAIEDGIITIDETKASENKKVVITIGETTCELPYKIVTGIEINENPTNITYEHGDTINFEDGSITINYSEGDSETIGIPEAIEQGLITIQPENADIDNKKATITYKDGTSTAEIDLTVTDPIVSIEVTKNPTKTEYNSGDTIEFEGGTIEATTKSGKKISDISMTDANVTKPITMADINSCSGDKWQNGDKEAGKQIITITYEGKQATFDITVNDTIASIAVKTQPTAKNKYGTEGNSLNLTGATLELTTAAGHVIEAPIAINIGMLDLTNYDPNDITNTQNLPVTYAGMTTAEGNGINIKLKDYITGITVTAPDDLTANYNEELDLSNVTYVKNYASGAASQSIPVTKAMIPGYNKTPEAGEFTNQQSEQTVTVTLSTPDDADIDVIPAEDTFNVTIKDKITGIAISDNPNNLAYNCGDTFNAQGGRISFTYASGATSSKTVSMTDSTVSITEADGSAINMSPTASEFTDGKMKKQLKVTYRDENGTTYTAPTQLTITIKDIIDRIELEEEPKKEFKHGETFETGSGTLKIIYKSGAERTIPLSEATITEAGGAVNMNPSASEYTTENGNKVTKSVTASYTEGDITKTVDYDITIINDIKSIKVNSTTHKTEYNVNDKLNVENLTIEVERAVGKETIEVQEGWVKDFDSTTEHKPLTLTITYEENEIEQTTTYNITVKDSVTSISINNAPTTAKYGEDLDLTGVTIDIEKGSGPANIPVKKDMIKDYIKEPEELGEQTVTVEYGGQTQTFKVVVKDYVKEITLDPASVTKPLNTELADIIKDVKYTVVYAKAGAKTPSEALTESMIKTAYDKTKVEQQELTVEYVDNDQDNYNPGAKVEATLAVTLENVITGVTITPPTKTKYNDGEELVLTGGKIILTYANGTTDETSVTLTKDMITEENGTAVNMEPTYDNTKPTSEERNKVEKTLKIKYTSENGIEGTVDYPITIINNIKSIEVHSTNHKTEYNVNDELDVENLEILVTREKGTPEAIEVQEGWVKDFDSTTEHKPLTLTITYEENEIEQTTTYNITVKDSVTSISINNAPTTAKYGEDLDLTGVTIDIEKGSGPATIPVTKDMIKDYKPNQLGEQTITVEYGGQTQTFKIVVKDYVTGITLNPTNVEGLYNTELEELIKDVKYTVNYAEAGAKTPSEALTESMIKTVYDKTKETQTLQIEYVDNDDNSATKGEKFTAQLSITLKDKVTGVTITGTAENTIYNHGEEINYNGIKIYVQHASDVQGSQGTPVAIKDATITDITDGETGAPTATTELPANVFNTDNTVTRTIRIYYEKEGESAQLDFEITVKNILDHIEIDENNTPKTSYEKGDPITNAGGKIKIYRKADKENSTETKNITDDMIKGLDTTKVGQNFEATVTYEEQDAHGTKITKQDTYKYEVTETVQSITLNPGPNKTTYKYGEDIDLTGAYLDIVKVNGTTDRVAVTENMISGFESTPNPNDLPETQIITVTYGEFADGTPATVTFTVTVEDEVTGIILTPPDKTTYKYGDTLDLTGGTVQKVMASGLEIPPVPLTDPSVNIEGYNPKKIGTQTIKVTYEGETKTFPVTVEEDAISIKIVNYPKQNYEYGEKLDITGGTIEVTRGNGDKEIIPITKEMVTGFNPNQSGTQKLTVTYGGQEDFYDVEISDNIVGIKITPPKKLVYKIGEKIDLTGGKVAEITASGKIKTPVNMTLAMISGFDTSSEGAKTITVTYKGHKATFNITVVDPLSDVQIITLPNKLNYKYGENLDVTGGTIQITKESGEKQTINITPEMVTGYNPNKIGQQTLKITYEGITKEFIVTVEDYATKLIVKAPDKKEYEYGEELNLAGGTVSIIMASGAVEENVEMTASMLSGYNKTQEGMQTIKVEYKGLQGNFQVKVIDKIKGISMNTLPNKTSYKNGQNLDLTGATIVVVKSSGTHIIPVTKDMVSGYNRNKAGKQVITVSYGGFTTNFVVTVAKKPSTPSTKPSKPSTPSTKPSDNTPIIKDPIIEDPVIENPIIDEPIIEEPIIDEPVTPTEPIIDETPKVEEPIIEKPTQVLGVKDEKDNNDNNGTIIIAGAISGLGILLLIILIVAFRRNVEIYVFEDGEFVLGGKDRITKRKARIDIDKFLDEETYPNPVKVILNKSISKKLDKEEIEIIHREQEIKHTIEYNDEEYEITLK